MRDYHSAVKMAEEAVSSMKDQKLKEIAFGQILAHLLSPGKQPAPGRAQPATRPPKKQTTIGSAKKKTGTIAWLRGLATDGFFKKSRHGKAILEELLAHSHRLRGSDLTWPLQQLCHDEVLRRKKIAPEKGKPPVWHWSNW